MWTDGQMDIRMDSRMGGRTDIQTDGQNASSVSVDACLERPEAI